jgi:hypothetical protein
MSPEQCYRNSLNAMARGDTQAAIAWGLAAVAGALLGAERLECRAPPLAELGRDHRRIGEWAQDVQDPRD